MREIKIGQTYRHFKGKEYVVIAIAKDCEDESKLVVYKALYGDYTVWVRPYDNFNSLVDRIKYPDVLQKYRFEECNAVIPDEVKEDLKRF